MSRPGVYQPGKGYNLINGLTVAEFENRDKAALAVIQEDGFFRDPSSGIDSIRLFNASGFDIFATLDEARAGVSPKLRNWSERFQQDEKNAIQLLHGCATHFPVGHRCFTLHLVQTVLSDKGPQKIETAKGYTYRQLSNCNILIKDSINVSFETNATLIPNVDNSGKTRILNTSSRPVDWYITVEETAYQQAPEDVQRRKMMRTNDLGPEIVDEGTLLSNAEAVLTLPTQNWYIHAVQPVNKRLGGMQLVDRVPNMRNYEDDGYVCAHNGQFVVFLKSENGNGIVVRAYDELRVKKVAASLAITNQYL